MKYLILIALLLVPCVAFAQQNFTPVSKEQANTYFASCVKQPPSEQFSAAAQNELCACTAARMTQFFSVEDMKAMTGTDPAIARTAYNKMLVSVYAPCMEGPTREHYYNTCITNPDTAKYGDAQKICTCLGNAMGAHLKVHGAEVFQQLLSYNPNITDPMGAMTSDPSFQTFAQQNLLKCVQ